MITYQDIAKASSTIRTTNIKGKDYAEVNQRIKAFRMVYPEGFILTEIVSNENGVIVMRATVGTYNEKGEPMTLGVGTAFEREESSYINKTSYVENCVPLPTQILTKDGWKFYYQLEVGQEVLSYNMETGNIEFCKVKDVHVYADHPIVELKTSRFCAKCTPQHKWVVKTQNGKIVKRETEDLRVSDKILQNVPVDIEATGLGKRLGWLMCDCEMTFADGLPSTAYIRQSKHVKEVSDLFGEGKKKKKYNSKWLDSYEWVVPAEDVRAILHLFGMASYKDLPRAMAKAPICDVKGCFESMMLADGESRGFSSTYPELIEAMEIMCARLGYATGIVKKRMMRKSTRPIYTLPIKKTSGAYCSEMKITKLPPQDVWCPTTENGTWFMKHGGMVSLTSNCETSCNVKSSGP